MKPARRLQCDNLTLRLPAGKDGFHALTVSLVWDESDRLQEIVFVGRGKPGHVLDQMFMDLGVMLSRAIQHRNPHTGAELSPEEALLPEPETVEHERGASP
jgi:hypothetical protein